jgi:hypothetical protein
MAVKFVANFLAQLWKTKRESVASITEKKQTTKIHKKRAQNTHLRDFPEHIKKDKIKIDTKKKNMFILFYIFKYVFKAFYLSLKKKEKSF